MPTEIKPSVPQTSPGTAIAERGTVILDGPDGVAVAMTADAALETGRRLVAAAEEAMRQAAHLDR